MNDLLTPDRLSLEGISKAFPGVLANDDVSLSVRPGEIHALLGENGAGKSTLVKMIYGIMQPDAGVIRWNGARVRMASPRQARGMGIGMVFQHFSLFEALTVAENIALGMDKALPLRELVREIRAVMLRYGIELEPERVVHTLSVGERQRIEIVRALLLNPQLLIMDEPTSVLTPQEVEQLFKVLRQLAENDCSVLYISHKLDEIKALCEKATILRGGRMVKVCDPRTETSRSMAEIMIGSSLNDIAKPEAGEAGPVRLKVNGLTAPAPGTFGTALEDISFSAHAGQIFGIAGIAGNGQNELLAALSGETRTDPGVITLDERKIGAEGPNIRRELGLCAVPEERYGHAAVPLFSLSENAILTARGRKGLTHRGFIRMGAAEAYAGEVIEAFGVRTTGPESQAGALSGGNLQKYIMGREILQNPEVLVVSQPTWGVDAGAAAAIRQALVDLAASGSAVVVISQDLDELLALANTIAVMHMGELSEARPAAEISIEDIGLLMAGVEPGNEGGQHAEA